MGILKKIVVCGYVLLLSGCASLPDTPSSKRKPFYKVDDPIQCVPYARGVSGIQIRGNAHTWWRQAEGRYERSNEPFL